MSRIPVFPHFEVLNLSHSEFMKRMTSYFPPYSDFNFTSLYSWDTDEAIGVASLHNNLIIRFSDYHTGKVFLSLLGTNKLTDTLPALFDYCRSHNIDQRLQLIPHSVVKTLEVEAETKYEITEDRNNHDYIVSTKKICLGDVNRRKRAVARQFREAYNDVTRTKPLELRDPATVKGIEALVSAWVSARGEQNADKKESVAIHRCLRHAEALGLRGLGTYIKDYLAGFILFDTLEKHTAMVHFGKADRSYRGLFDNLKIELAKQTYSEGVEFMNFEQDLGVEGLRNDKLAFNPVDFLKKYTISEKS